MRANGSIHMWTSHRYRKVRFQRSVSSTTSVKEHRFIQADLLHTHSDSAQTLLSVSYVRKTSSRNLLFFPLFGVSVQGRDRCRSHNRIPFQDNSTLPSDLNLRVQYAKRSLIMRYCLDRAWVSSSALNATDSGNIY
jgi:hypothetical protein